MNWKAAAPLFQGWNKPMIFAALQGCMGRVVTRGGEPPRSARLEVGDFAFFAGEPDRELAREAAAPILVPQNEAWAELLGRVWGTGSAPGPATRWGRSRTASTGTGWPGMPPPCPMTAA